MAVPEATFHIDDRSKLSLEPFEYRQLIVNRCAADLLEQFYARWFGKRRVLQPFVAIRTFRAEVSKFCLPTL